MIERLIKKMVRGIGILLVLAILAVGVVALRFAIYAPELLDNILCVIGG